MKTFYILTIVSWICVLRLLNQASGSKKLYQPADGSEVSGAAVSKKLHKN